MFWLIAQILFCLLIAGLLGLFFGWLIWGRRSDTEPSVHSDTIALGASIARIRELERDLAECTKAAEASAASAIAGGVAAASAGGYGLFGPVADTAIDDLKKISGVGPVIEKQLAGIGVTTYGQIANFDADDILRVHEAIGFVPGRIEREDWVTQAAQLHREAYGTSS